MPITWTCSMHHWIAKMVVGLRSETEIHGYTSSKHRLPSSLILGECMIWYRTNKHQTSCRFYQIYTRNMNNHMIVSQDLFLLSHTTEKSGTQETPDFFKTKVRPTQFCLLNQCSYVFLVFLMVLPLSATDLQNSKLLCFE